ncbi:hypothetical protein [Pedobacter sp.]
MKITQDKNFHKLFETDIYLVGHIFETTYLIDKTNEYSIILGDSYGDPSCALIDKDNKWCLVGGSTLILWTPDNTVEIKDDNLYWASKLRQTDTNKAHILIDRWANNSSIWEIDINSTERKKLSDFDNYKNKEFTENIDW